MTANSKGPREDAVGDGGEAFDETELAATPELPSELTVAETLDWVSGDKAKAKVALEAEQKRDKPRSGVVDGLSSLVNDETGAGVASGEA
jgi:hypothetical protein